MAAAEGLVRTLRVVSERQRDEHRDATAGAASIALPRLSLIIGIATRGRPAILKETLAALVAQSDLADAVTVCYVDGSDVGDAPILFPSVSFLQSAAGLCMQRNRILRSCTGQYDLILFLDDDFFMDPGYLAVTRSAFARQAQMVASTGQILADGIGGPGLTLEDAARVLRSAEAAQSTPVPAYNTYGCNMAFRLDAIEACGLFFDEALPAYAWHEDVDFSRRLSACTGGWIRRVPNAMGVHLGAKVGRLSGRRLGYSQIANPVYLFRKGSYPWYYMAQYVGRNLLANLLRSLRPEAYVDRRGRLWGNVLALRDLFAGRIRPDRILTIAVPR